MSNALYGKIQQMIIFAAVGIRDSTPHRLPTFIIAGTCIASQGVFQAIGEG